MIAEQFPRFIDNVYTKSRVHSALGHVSPVHFEEAHCQISILTLSGTRGLT